MVKKKQKIWETSTSSKTHIKNVWSFDTKTCIFFVEKKKCICYQKTSILKRHITIAIGAKYNAKIAHIENKTHNNSNRCLMAKCIDTFNFWVVFFYVFGFIPKSQLVSPHADYIFSFIPFTISYYIHVFFSIIRILLTLFVPPWLWFISFRCSYSISLRMTNIITIKKKKQNEPK